MFLFLALKLLLLFSFLHWEFIFVWSHRTELEVGKIIWIFNNVCFYPPVTGINPFGSAHIGNENKDNAKGYHSFTSIHAETHTNPYNRDTHKDTPKKWNNDQTRKHYIKIRLNICLMPAANFINLPRERENGMKENAKMRKIGETKRWKWFNWME